MTDQQIRTAFVWLFRWFVLWPLAAYGLIQLAGGGC